jgi:hypothetical protein
VWFTGFSARPADPGSRYNVLTGVSADSATDAWAAGFAGTSATGHFRTLLLRWNGTAWSVR